MTKLRKRLYTLAFAAYAIAFGYVGYQKLHAVPELEPVLIYDRDISHLVIDLINNSEKSIHLAIFNIMHQEVINALYAAKKRGVDVRIVTDVSAILSPWSQIKKMYEQGLPIRFFRSIGPDKKLLDVMHHKYMVVDGKTVETGSNNYTYKGFGVDSRDKYDASVFSETMFIIRNNPRFAKQYEENWKGLWEKAEPYNPETFK